MKLRDRVVIVTGTSPNIGGGIAEGLAAEGAHVACVDLNRRNAEDCAAAIRAAGGCALGVVADVTDPAAVEGLLRRVTDELGPVTVLVNNAAIFDQQGVLDMAHARWSRQLAVILDGAFLCTQVVARQMVARRSGGAIISVISTAGHQGQPGNVGYCTAKAGLLNFTRSVAMELAPYGIRVNSLTPTATDPRESIERAVRWGRERPSDAVVQFFEEFRRSVPMQSLPTPTDYARAVTFLASDDARHMTGADLRIDAGALARYWAWNPAQQRSDRSP
ncbi:MAG: SDR family oxidoreductase [Deltaproteobacteria bacterium]|nr:SDR family oxidoreductase [Deltaproteobacteria bacterium]